jgi:hypothetical protein
MGGVLLQRPRRYRYQHARPVHLRHALLNRQLVLHQFLRRTADVPEPEPELNADRYADTDADPHGHADPYGHAYSDADADWHSDTHTDPNADPDPHPQAHANADPDAHRDTDTFAN